MDSKFDRLSEILKEQVNTIPDFSVLTISDEELIIVYEPDRAGSDFIFAQFVGPSIGGILNSLHELLSETHHKYALSAGAFVDMSYEALKKMDLPISRMYDFGNAAIDCLRKIRIAICSEWPVMKETEAEQKNGGILLPWNHNYSRRIALQMLSAMDGVKMSMHDGSAYPMKLKVYSWEYAQTPMRSETLFIEEALRAVKNFSVNDHAIALYRTRLPVESTPEILNSLLEDSIQEAEKAAVIMGRVRTLLELSL